jgi:hypothetical protein
MNTMRSTLLMLLAFASFVSAQQETSGSDEPAEQATPTEEAGDAASTAEAEADDEAIDDEGLDAQGFEQDDDDFVPTEEISTDQSIPFPTDI